MTTQSFLPNTTKSFIVLYFSLFISICCAPVLLAQDKMEIVDAFADYTASAREVIHVHLNKSTFIKGEAVGFTAYVFDKKQKMPALLTTNLYLSLEDEQQNPVKQQLLKVENGVASNVFILDDAFKTGTYTLKAYTNWSRNFKEHNYFSANIEIIDPQTDKSISYERVENALDAQFLPESGHLLADVVNKIGVVVKDPKGYGVPNATGEVFNSKNESITTFQLNHLGIGNFVMIPSLGDRYRIVLTHRMKEFSFLLDQKTEPVGLTLATATLGKRLFINVKTNSRSFDQLKNRNYKLSMHNGDFMQASDIWFDESLTVTRVIDLDELSPGVNVFTVFDPNNRPVAERLFFNYQGLPLASADDLHQKKVRDSLRLTLSYDSIDPNAFSNLSVSVLPSKTEAYRHNHNLISKLYIQPYVQGQIENAAYYFTNINSKRALDLDNLLLTQGWSSYSWNAIFNNNNQLPFDFEQGISLKANTNADVDAQQKYMLHAMQGSGPMVIELSEGSNTFTLEDVFISDRDTLSLSYVNKNSSLEPARLYLQSFPSSIPEFKLNTQVLGPKPNYGLVTTLKDNTMSFDFITNLQQLDEVVVETHLTYAREKQIAVGSRFGMGRAFVPNQMNRLNAVFLSDYLRNLGLGVIEGPNQFSVSRIGTGGGLTNRDFTNWRGSTTPGRGLAIYLDGVLVNDGALLAGLPMNQIDYVVYNPTGIGLGGLGGRGAIAVYTLRGPSWEDANLERRKIYNLPLTFSSQKEFYTPVYQYRSGDFYESYGTVAWEPNLKVNEQGKVSLTVKQPLVPVSLFIEGVADDGTIISEIREVVPN